VAPRVNGSSGVNASSGVDASWGPSAASTGRRSSPHEQPQSSWLAPPPIGGFSRGTSGAASTSRWRNHSSPLALTPNVHIGGFHRQRG
jgi:hypothetical protein